MDKKQQDLFIEHIAEIIKHFNKEQRSILHTLIKSYVIKYKTDNIPINEVMKMIAKTEQLTKNYNYKNKEKNTKRKRK